ncbi:JmjC domain, hydroxylase-domain-containing protein [Phycomyces blakesleeanus]
MMPANRITPSEYYDQENGGKVPIFRPTMEQFKDFRKFILDIERYGREAGMVKVIPPKEWKDEFDASNQSLDHLKVEQPPIQSFIGTNEICKQELLSNEKDYTLGEWLSLCQEKEHRPPNILPNEDREKNPSNQFPSTFGSNIVPKGHYNTEYYREMEINYWHRLKDTTPYCGKSPSKSLFNAHAKGWNLNDLDGILRDKKVSIPPLTEPHLAFGMWKSTFAWHLEHLNLYSINYLHIGASKQWYAIPPGRFMSFEIIMGKTFPEMKDKCKSFLRHRAAVMSPRRLADHSIPVNKCVQHEGEFLITFPYSYHYGYNLDFNCSESVNFAINPWINVGCLPMLCGCTKEKYRVHYDTIKSFAIRYPVPPEMRSMCKPGTDELDPDSRDYRRYARYSLHAGIASHLCSASYQYCVCPEHMRFALEGLRTLTRSRPDNPLVVPRNSGSNSPHCSHCSSHCSSRRSSHRSSRRSSRRSSHGICNRCPRPSSGQTSGQTSHPALQRPFDQPLPRVYDQSSLRAYPMIFYQNSDQVFAQIPRQPYRQYIPQTYAQALEQIDGQVYNQPFHQVPNGIPRGVYNERYRQFAPPSPGRRSV